MDFRSPTREYNSLSNVCMFELLSDTSPWLHVIGNTTACMDNNVNIPSLNAILIFPAHRLHPCDVYTYVIETFAFN